MSETDKYSIRYSTEYERHLTALLKAHYKRDKKSGQAFLKGLNSLIAHLEYEPLAIGDQEPWPHGTHQEGWDLRKMRFKMPGLHGQAREGRFVYLVDFGGRVVVPLMAYTHKQYTGRPDAQLRGMIQGEMS